MKRRSLQKWAFFNKTSLPGLLSKATLRASETTWSIYQFFILDGPWGSTLTSTKGIPSWMKFVSWHAQTQNWTSAKYQSYLATQWSMPAKCFRWTGDSSHQLIHRLTFVDMPTALFIGCNLSHLPFKCPGIQLSPPPWSTWNLRLLMLLFFLLPNLALIPRSWMAQLELLFSTVWNC